MKYLNAFLLIILTSSVALSTERSAQWPQVRRTFLKSHPMCAVCNATSDLEVHHIRPFHLQPELELDEKNLITLCKSKAWGIRCHFDVGHGGNFKYENPNVKEDAEYLHNLGLLCKQKLPLCLADALNEIKQKVRRYNCEIYKKCSKRKTS